MTRTKFPVGLSFLAAVLTGLATGLPAMAAEGAESSADKARQALATLRSDASSAEKAIACKRLAVFGGPEAVSALAPLLADEHLAAWARIPLEVIPGPAPDEALRGALGRLYGNLLVGVINSIGVRGDSMAVNPLVARLKDDNHEVAAAAAVALGRIGGATAAGALRSTLSSPTPAVRSAAAEGLILSAERLAAEGKAGEAMDLYDAARRADVPLQRVLEATRGAILTRQSEGLPLLLETLRSPDRDVFNMGLRTARELPGRQVTESLASELHRVSAERQGPLLLALADRSDEAVWPAVFSAAGKGTPSVRLVAIAAVERRGDPASVPVLLKAATDPEEEVSNAAKAALGRLSGPDIDGALVARLPQSTGSERQVLVELSGRRRLNAAVPHLLKAAEDSDADLRSAGIRALGETMSVGDMGKAVDLLIKARSEDDLSDLEAALDAACDRLDDKSGCAEAVLARLSSSPAPARGAMLRVLGTAGTADGLSAVRASLASDDASVREAAFRVLTDWPDAAAVSALVDFVRFPRDDTQRTLALRGAVRLLGSTGQSSEQRIRTYGALLAASSRPDDRRLVLSGIGTVPDPAALELVQPLLRDGQVRKEAEVAMLSIAGTLAGSQPALARSVAVQLQRETSDASTRDRAGQLLQSMDKVEDYIITWQFAGAYRLASGEGGSVFAREFPPEKGDTTVAWRPLRAGTQSARPWMLDLQTGQGGDTHCAGYARAWVHSEVAQPVRVEFGTDDGHKLWCNGEPVAQADRGGAAVPGEFKTIVSLRKGWNLILLKVTQDTGPWEFCLRLRTPAGGRLEGLRVQALPPET